MATRTWWLRVTTSVFAVAAVACGGSDGSGSAQDAGGVAEAATGGDGQDAPSDQGDGGKGDGGNGDAEAISACEVVTEAEIEGFLGGGSVGEGQLVGNTCSWPVGDVGESLDAVGVSVTDTTDFTTTAEEGVGSMRDGFGSQAIELADLGDEAVTDGAGMLAFRSGDWYVTVGVYVGQDVAANQSAAESLGHLVAGRL